MGPKYSESPSPHDLGVSLLLKQIAREFPDAELFGADGCFPFQDCLSVPVVEFAGYRPDTVFVYENSFIVGEVKSFGDLETAHTAEQLNLVRMLVSLDYNLRFVLGVIGINGVKQALPASLSWIETTARCRVVYLF